MNERALHLMTQRGQPYGSERRCCERCGIMIWPHPQPDWTNDEAVYRNPPLGFHPCSKNSKAPP